LARTSLLLAMIIAAAASPATALDDARWLSPDADRAAALTTAPAECLSRPADAETAWRVALGRVAFRSPALLGGLAARAGMSCDTCHRNGHGNPAFFIAGVSDAPGTADVTSAVFSQSRGDGIDNPVPIPDLTGVGAKSRFGTMRPADGLSAFVHSVIVEEFQGAEPSPIVLEALVAYLTGLDPRACPTARSAALTFAGAARDLADTYAVLLGALDRHDPATADVVLRSLNLALGRLAQRFPDAPESSATLPSLGRDLAAIRPLLAARPDDARKALAAWRARLDETLAVLARHEGSSLFERAAVERFLAGAPGR
jgi:hypothetical protein